MIYFKTCVIFSALDVDKLKAFDMLVEVVLCPGFHLLHSGGFFHGEISTLRSAHRMKDSTASEISPNVRTDCPDIGALGTFKGKIGIWQMDFIYFDFMDGDLFGLSLDDLPLARYLV